MFVQTRPVLRCERCGHHHSHHGPKGCMVCKVNWDATPDVAFAAKCKCEGYTGQWPPVVETDPGACPHEVQVDLDPTLCVYCGKRIPKTGDVTL